MKNHSKEDIFDYVQTILLICGPEGPQGFYDMLCVEARANPEYKWSIENLKDLDSQFDYYFKKMNWVYDFNFASRTFE